ncbi:DUF2325 domain-containing protein [Nitrosovibrio sp. Nv17]|uniref:DUF2325 domain-containing protein n=1 Tax=Nitrosovibrio sp. Nv17 TaxID=1855339 RepID=UPI00090882DD|nr:DUF2325 domain-containing protein [Nitrosovibrio sp. Nv17]SFW30452.1 hypothetical protein SAMN05216414_1148 [Nitrosovibrio sp. Nv17]
MHPHSTRNTVQLARPRRPSPLQYRLQALRGALAHLIGRLIGNTRTLHLAATMTSLPGVRPEQGVEAVSQAGSPGGQPGRAPLPPMVLIRSCLRARPAPSPDADSPVRLIKAPAIPAVAEGGDEAGSTRFDLGGLCILCVGGRATLYPAYRRLIEASGGHFLIYRGDPQEKISYLPTLLTRADAIICPVDCVNHTVYFAIRRYCTRFGKPCAMLERSGLPTFRRGVEMLAAAAS